jgi:cytochrome c oxidase subunit 2
MILQTTIMPEQASEMSWHVDNLIWFITAVTAIGGLGVYAAILVFCIWFRRRTPNALGYAPTPRILGSHKLELIWTVTPLVIFLAIFFWGAWVYNHALHPPEDAPEIYVVGKQWMWKVQYPEGQRVILGQNSLEYQKAVHNQGYFEGVMVLPVNRPVKITVTSEDVIHDFGIPAFRQKLDAVPGQYRTTWYLPTKIGTYDVFCDQYCGTNHSLMVGKIMVVSDADYQAWLDGYWTGRPTTNALDGSLAHQGRQLFQKLNCIQCHDPQKAKAPVLEGIWMSKRPIRGGGMVEADQNYIVESIRRPRAKVREGWEPIMPAFGPDKVSEDDLIKLVAYLKSLRKGETPVRTEDWTAPVGAITETPPPAKSTEGGGPK